jgi:hypothetical protein
MGRGQEDAMSMTCGVGSSRRFTFEEEEALRRDESTNDIVRRGGYKTKRLAGDFGAVPKESRSPAFKMTEALLADKKGRMQLQLNADRGLNAARDLVRSGMTAEAFLRSNPKVADAYMKDAAFHEGFDAYLQTKANAPSSELKQLDRALDERDGWYCQSAIPVRV